MIQLTRNFITKYRYEIIGSIICLALGMMSGYISNSADSLWYMSIKKPSFNPPSWIFGPVWTVLYIMMGIALAKIWLDRLGSKNLLMLFAIQLALNLSWSPLFFYFHRIDLALYNIVMLWISLIAIIYFSIHKRTIMLLFIPYLLWVSFAMVLNVSIYKANHKTASSEMFRMYDKFK